MALWPADDAEARGDLAAWILCWQEKYSKLCAWVEENIEETFTFYRLPREHHKHLKSTNMLERIQLAEVGRFCAENKLSRARSSGGP